MSQFASSSQPPRAPNEFDAAKSIVEALRGLDKQQQTRAMRFARESLGLVVGYHHRFESPEAERSEAITPRDPIHAARLAGDLLQWIEDQALGLSPRQAQILVGGIVMGGAPGLAAVLEIATLIAGDEPNNATTK
jgi:hypothetical protein